jgi:hypothetical protein
MVVIDMEWREFLKKKMFIPQDCGEYVVPLQDVEEFALLRVKELERKEKELEKFFPEDEDYDLNDEEMCWNYSELMDIRGKLEVWRELAGEKE